MALVVILDSDTAETNRLIERLGSRGHVALAGCAARVDSARADLSGAPDAAVVRIEPADGRGIGAIRRVRSLWPECRIAASSKRGGFRHAGKALTAGAELLVGWPYELEEIMAVLPPLTHESPCHLGHGVLRLARRAFHYLSAPSDVSTLEEFGRAVGVSRGALRAWCRTAGIPPRAFLFFSRALRAVHLTENDPSLRPSDVLSFCDVRTIRRFCIMSGGTANELPPTVQDFVARQTIISDTRFIAAIGSR